MRIDNTHNINNLPNKKNLEMPKEAISQGVKTESASVYEKTGVEAKSLVYDLDRIEQLSNQSEDLLGQLKEMVEEVLTEQSKTLELLKQENIIKANIGRLNIGKENIVEIDGVRVDEDIIARAKELISANGPLGEERASEEITEFVKLASDGEKGKLDVLMESMDRNFKEIEELLGKLPDISKRTYDRIIEKLDNFILLENLDGKEKPEVQLEKMLEEIISKQSKVSELLEQGNIVKGHLLEEAIDGQRISKENILNQNIAKTDTGKEGIIGESTNKLDLLKADIVKNGLTGLDEDIMSEAKALIGKSGQKDIEEMSEKILDFVKSASGGDREKLGILKAVVDKGFNEAEKRLGLLPEISQKTYSRIMLGLRSWEEELERRRYPGWPIFAESMNLYRKIWEYNRFGIRTYISIIFVSLMIYYGLRYLIR